jgi:hypothetical protein
MADLESWRDLDGRQKEQGGSDSDQTQAHPSQREVAADSDDEEHTGKNDWSHGCTYRQ